jgi:hypothetical protein
MQYYLNQIAQAGASGGTARANALTRRTEEIATWQPSLQKKMDTELAVMKARGKADGTWTDEDDLVFASNPVALYIGKNDPTADVTYWSPASKKRLRAAIGEKAAQQRIGADEAGAARPQALQPTPEELAAFHKEQAAKGSKAKITGRARLELPRGQRNAAIPKDALKIESGDTALTVDIYKMNLEQLKNLRKQLTAASTDPDVDEETRRDVMTRLKEVSNLYSGPVDKEISRVGRNIEAVGGYVTAGLDAVSSLMETNRAETAERTRKLLTVPEATGGGTIGSPKSASGK